MIRSCLTTFALGAAIVVASPVYADAKGFGFTEDLQKSLEGSAASAAARGHELVPNKREMEKKSIEFNEAFGLEHPSMANIPQVGGNMGEGDTLSFQQSNKYALTLWLESPDEQCLESERCYNASSGTTSFQLGGARLKVIDKAPLTVQICDKGQSGGFCSEEEDWTEPAQLSASTLIEGRPLMVDDTGAPRSHWRFEADCEETGQCELIITNNYRHGGTPTQPLGPNNPNTGAKERFDAHPAAAIGRKVYEPDPSDENYNPAFDYKLLGGGRDENNMFVGGGSLAADNQECYDLRKQAMAKGGTFEVPIRCDDPALGSFTFTTDDLVNVREPKASVEEDETTLGEVAAAVSIVEQIATHSDVNESTGEIEIFAGEATYCKKVRTGFKNWAQVSTTINPLLAVFVNDVGKLDCCADNPKDINTGRNFGHCKAHEKDLATSRMDGSAYHIKGARTVGDKTICVGAITPAGVTLIGGEIPLIGDNARSYTGGVAGISAWYKDRLKTPKICGGASQSAKAMAAFALGRPGRDLYSEGIIPGAFSAARELPVNDREYYCSFPSMLARIFHEQGRKQINHLAKLESTGAETLAVSFPYYGVARTESRKGGTVMGDHVASSMPSTDVDASIQDSDTDQYELVEAKTNKYTRKITPSTRMLESTNGKPYAQSSNQWVEGYMFRGGFIESKHNTYWTMTQIDGAEGDNTFIYLSPPGEYSKYRSNCTGKHAITSRWTGKACITYTTTRNLFSPGSRNGELNAAYVRGTEADNDPDFAGSLSRYPQAQETITVFLDTKNSLSGSDWEFEVLFESVVDKHYRVKGGSSVDEGVDDDFPMQNPGEVIAQPGGSVHVAGGSYDIPSTAGWLPEWVLNSNRFTFWQWDGACGSDDPDVTDTLFEQTGSCPLSNGMYMAVCDTADCGELPDHPFATADSDWTVHLLDTEEKLEVGALNRYVLTQGGCDIEDNLCSYKISALPRGAGGQLHVDIPISWSRYDYDAPKGGHWDKEGTISTQSVHFQAWVYPPPNKYASDTEGIEEALANSPPRLRYCVGLANKCLPLNDDWASVEEHWSEEGVDKTWVPPVPADPGHPGQEYRPPSPGQEYIPPTEHVPAQPEIPEVKEWVTVATKNYRDRAYRFNGKYKNYASCGERCYVISPTQRYLVDNIGGDVRRVTWRERTQEYRVTQEYVPAVPEVPGHPGQPYIPPDPGQEYIPPRDPTPEVPGYWEFDGKPSIGGPVELEGIRIHDDPEIWIRGGDCTDTFCEYRADAYLKVEAMPWLKKPMTHKMKELVYRNELKVAGQTVVSKGSYDVPYEFRSHPNCEGFSLEQFMALDMSQIDLTEYVETVTGEAKEKLDDFFN